MKHGRKPMTRLEVRYRYSQYLRSGSLAATARLFGCSAQALHILFQRHGFSTARQDLKPARRFAGRKFTIDSFGYWRETATRGTPKKPGVEVMLHRCVWEKHHGPIPAKHCVIFRDGDRLNCAIGNLQLVTKSQAMRIHSTGRNQFTASARTRLGVLLRGNTLLAEVQR